MKLSRERTSPPLAEQETTQTEITEKVRGRLRMWLHGHRPAAWLISASLALIMYVFILPQGMRAIFWADLQTHRFMASLVLIFSMLAISLIWAAGQRLDAWAFLKLNMWGARPPWLDHLMLSFTQIGSALAALGIAVLLFLFGERLLAYELVLGTLTLWMVVETVKFIINRARPFILLTQARIVGYRASGRSFPSGHTSQTFFMATLIAQHFHTVNWLALLLYGVALLVGVTRMYVGAHYPRDVLAGAVLGSFWGLMAVIVFGYALDTIG
jgi:membrane-associated phospholipid phosphatase